MCVCVCVCVCVYVYIYIYIYIYSHPHPLPPAAYLAWERAASGEYGDDDLLGEPSDLPSPRFSTASNTVNPGTGSGGGLLRGPGAHTLARTSNRSLTESPMAMTHSDRLLLRRSTPSNSTPETAGISSGISPSLRRSAESSPAMRDAGIRDAARSAMLYQKSFGTSALRTPASPQLATAGVAGIPGLSGLPPSISRGVSLGDGRSGVPPSILRGASLGAGSVSVVPPSVTRGASLGAGSSGGGTPLPQHRIPLLASKAAISKSSPLRSPRARFLFRGPSTAAPSLLEPGGISPGSPQPPHIGLPTPVGRRDRTQSTAANTAANAANAAANATSQDVVAAKDAGVNPSGAGGGSTLPLKEGAFGGPPGSGGGALLPQPGREHVRCCEHVHCWEYVCCYGPSEGGRVWATGAGGGALPSKPADRRVSASPRAAPPSRGGALHPTTVNGGALYEQPTRR